MVNDVILYKTDDGKSAIELHLDNGTVWLSQQELAELFQTSKQNISKHIKAIFEDGELDETVVVNYQLTTTRHGAMAGKTQSKKTTSRKSKVSRILQRKEVTDEYPRRNP